MDLFTSWLEFGRNLVVWLDIFVWLEFGWICSPVGWRLIGSWLESGWRLVGPSPFGWSLVGVWLDCPSIWLEFDWRLFEVLLDTYVWLKFGWSLVGFSAHLVGVWLEFGDIFLTFVSN